MVDFKAIRQKMVKAQIRTNKVTDIRIVEAMETIPREIFVPENKKHLAYIDEDLLLDNGRYLQEPFVLARLVQSLEIKDTDIVLDIGCGTGYSTALLGALADTVVGLESEQELADKADDLINSLNICNTAVTQGELRDGYARQKPYNVIFINGSVAEVPKAILKQLTDGGRLATIISGNGHMGVATLFFNDNGTIKETVLFDAAAPTLLGFEKEKIFKFC